MFQDEAQVGQPPARAPLPEGAQMYADMVAGGSPRREADEWRQQMMRDMFVGGSTPDEIDSYFGMGARSSPESQAAYTTNNQRYGRTTGLLDSLAAGWNMSASGLALRGEIPQNNMAPDGLAANITYGLGQFAGDLPFAIGGALAGGAGGGAAGTAIEPGGGTAIGGAMGAGFGAGAVPEAVRQYYVGALRGGEAENFGDWVTIITDGAWETTKSGLAGAAGGAVGSKVGGAVAGRTGSRALGIGAEMTASGVTEIGVLAGLNGQMPTRDDFVTAAVISLAAGGVTNFGTRTNGAVNLNEQGRRVEQNLQELYVQTGMSPQELANRARTDPRWREVIMGQDPSGHPVPPPNVTPVPPQPYEGNLRNVSPLVRGLLLTETLPRNTPLEMVRREPIPASANIDSAMRLMSGSEGSHLAGAATATSPAGARGLYQIMPGTARQYGFDPDRLMDPVYNTRVARTIMTDLYNRYGGDEELMLTAYNAGPGRANTLRDKGPGTRLVAIRDRRAANGWRWETEQAARDESWLPMETQKYLARARTNNGGELPGSRGGSGRFIAIAQAGGGDPPSGGGGEGGGGPPRSSEGVPDWALPVPKDEGGDMGPPLPPPPPDPPGGNWDDASPGDRYAKIREGFDDGVNTPSTFADNVSLAITHWVSELEPARRLDTEFARDNPEFNRDQDIGLEDMARLVYSSPTRANAMIRDGAVRLAAGDARKDGVWDIEFVLDRDAATVQKAVEQLKKTGGDLDDFFAWVAAQRTVRRDAAGFDTPFDTAAARSIVSDKAEAKKYEGAAKTLRDSERGLFAYAQDSGLFSKAQVDEFFRMDPFYLSFRQARGDDTVDLSSKPKTAGGLKGGTGVRKMKGSKRDRVLDPRLTIIDNFHTLTTMADKNRARLHAVEMMEKGEKAFAGLKRIEDKPSATFSPEPGAPFERYSKDAPALGPLEEVFAAERSKLGDDEFVVYRDGKPEYYKAETPELARLLRGAETRAEANIVMKVAGGIAALARAGIVLPIDFAVKVSLVDQMSSFVLAPDHPPPFVGPVRGVLHALGGRADDTFMQWAINGGAGASLVSMDTNYVRRATFDAMERTGTLDKVVNVVRSPLEAAQIFSERVDAASRIGAYKRNAPKVGKTKAALLSRTSFLDFSEAGTLAFIRGWSKIVPFQRAGILGAKQVGQAITDPAKALGRKPAELALFLAMGVVLPSAVLFLLNKEADKTLAEGERYSDLPDWQRDMFFITPPILGQRLKIRKPHMVGVASGGLMERFLTFLETDDPEAFEGLRKSLLQDTAIPALPPALVAPAEQITGYDFFSQRRLIPASLEQASPQMQYTEATTETSKKLARLLGPGGMDVAEISPIVLDNYLREWTGTIGYEAMRILGGTLKEPGTTAPSELADNPFVKSFLVRSPRGGADQVQDFYENYGEFQQAARDKALALDRRDPFEVDTYAHDPRAYVNVAKIAEILALQRDMITAVTNNADMNDDEKRQRIDNLYMQMIRVSTAGNRIMETVEAGARDNDAERPPVEGAPEPERPQASPFVQGLLNQPAGRGNFDPPTPAAPGNPSLAPPLEMPSQ